MDEGHRRAPGPGSPGFLAGVIEGFYGRPWTREERSDLFDRMAAFGLTTYLYAPKDDLKHRALWRETYAADEAEALAALVRSCGERGIRFIYAISPGLDIRFSSEADRARLWQRVDQMTALGCGHFALLFDDIPDRMHHEDAARWPYMAAAQAEVASALFRRVRERQPGARFLFCPTPYCGRMAERQLGGPGYLDTIGRELDAGVDICWTGPDIVSREISVAHVRGVRDILKRKPVIWDNLHANDYDGQRFYCGPYAGRPRELREEVAGILSNPNCELPLNDVPLRTLGEFLRGSGPWDERSAYLAAMAAWLPRFATVGPPVELEDLLLLGDCYYLPCEEGPLAAAFIEAAGRLLASDPAGWGERRAALQAQAERLRGVCARMADLRDRPLFHALSRRVWDLREEMDLLLAAIRIREADPHAPIRSDYHLPGTYRGGAVARLRQLLRQQPDGAFVPEAEGSRDIDTAGSRAPR